MKQVLSSRTDLSLSTKILAMLFTIFSGISTDMGDESPLLAPPGCWTCDGSDQLLGWRAVAKISPHKFQLCA